MSERGVIHPKLTLQTPQVNPRIDMDTHPKITLPERIRCARKQAGMSQEGLRLVVGAGKGMGQKWELSEGDQSYRCPSPETLLTIALVCGVSPEWLMTGEGEMAQPYRLEAGKRITAIIQSLGGAAVVGPRFEGVTPETLRRWMRVGVANLGEAANLERNLLAAGVPQEKILTTTDPSSDPYTHRTEMARIRNNEVTIRRPHARKDKDWVAIPVYTARAAAGPGYTNSEDEVSSEILLSPDHIRQVLRVPPEALAVVHVEGDSMVPALHSGDAIFIDTRPPGPPTDGIYLLRLGDALMVKQVQRLPGGAIQVSSRNAAYAPYTITHENSEGFEVLGRVVGKCGRV